MLSSDPFPPQPQQLQQQHETRASSQPSRNWRPSCTTAWDLWQQRQQQTQAAKCVDDNSFCLPPWWDFPTTARSSSPGRIYELVGAAGTGKTQWALQWAVTVVTRQNEPDAAVYLLSTTALNGKLERLQHFLSSSTCTSTKHPNALERIWTQRLWNWDQLLESVHELVSQTTKQPKSNHHIQLLVIDSLADLVRGTDTTTAGNHHNDPRLPLAYLAQLLMQLPYPTLVVNQVTGNHHRPALGVTWAHCVHQRYTTTTSTTDNHPPISPSSSSSRTCRRRRRILQLTKSHQYPVPQSMEFVIDKHAVSFGVNAPPGS